jgi:ATP adenylyltransferase
MAYIDKAEPQEGCVFCELPAKGVCEETLVLHRGELVFVVLNRFPYVSGHLMVIPYSHAGRPDLLLPEEWTGIMDVARTAVRALETVYRPQGFNLGMNVGRAAGAGIDEHLHMHVIPRWNGDTNFVPVLSDTRVIPEALPDTWHRLRPFFEDMEKQGANR